MSPSSKVGTRPVMVVTGREDVDAVDRAYGAGATSFVVKPLNWRLLSHQLRYVHRTAINERQMADSRAASRICMTTMLVSREVRSPLGVSWPRSTAAR